MSNDIPAFPIPLNTGESYLGHHVCDGMTLRDYFAAKAIQALISSQVCDKAFKHKLGTAGLAYDFADAMLEARK